MSTKAKRRSSPPVPGQQLSLPVQTPTDDPQVISWTYEGHVCEVWEVEITSGSFWFARAKPKGRLQSIRETMGSTEDEARSNIEEGVDEHLRGKAQAERRRAVREMREAGRLPAGGVLR